jgi:hypothetical protein
MLFPQRRISSPVLGGTGNFYRGGKRRLLLVGIGRVHVFWLWAARETAGT